MNKINGNTLPVASPWLLALVVALAAPAQAWTEAEARQLAGAMRDFDRQGRFAPAAVDKLPRQYLRFGPRLERWVSGMADKALDEQQKNLLQSGREELAVQVRARPGEGASLRRWLAAQGAMVQGAVGDTLFVRVNKGALEKLAGQELLAAADIQGIVSAWPDDSLPLSGLAARLQGGATGSKGQGGDGIPLTGVTAAHARGITGKGVRVGILDFGFGGYDRLQQGGVLPAPVAAQVFFRSNPGVAMGGTVHGTACAEIIHQMAPDATLLIAQVGNGAGSAAEGDIVEAARWLVEQGVDIINFSGGGQVGPHDGTSVLDDMVNRISAQGVLWVNANGNDGGSHWLGQVVDKDGNGFVDIPGNNQGDFLLVETCGERCGGFTLSLNWDDWKDGAVDVDAWLLGQGSNGQPYTAGEATTRRTGAASPAMEFLSFPRGLPAGSYALVMRTAQPASGKRLHVYAQGGARLAQRVPEGSLGVPATADKALSVGALDAVSQRVAEYSGRGTTDDNRLKPDISAPAGVTSQSYDLEKPGTRFHGTSAAAPHAAGFAALVKQRFASYDGAALKQWIMQQGVKPVAGQRPDIHYGHGVISAEGLLAAAPPPEPETPLPPAAGSGDTGIEAIERLRRHLKTD